MSQSNYDSEEGPKQPRRGFSYPSTHAALRIKQRTSMSAAELMTLLDHHVCVDVTQEYGLYGLNKRHLLFYSVKDKYYYVAIQNEHSGKVITVLHLSYHRQTAWPISEEQCQQARSTYFDYVSAQQTQISDEKSEDNQLVEETFKTIEGTDKKRKQVTSFKRTYKVLVKALYVYESGQLKRKTLFKLKVDYYINDFKSNIEQLLKSDEQVLQKINHYVRRKRLFHESIYRVVFENKKDPSESFRIDLQPHWIARDNAEKIAKQRLIMNELLLDYETSHISLPLPTSMGLLRLSSRPYQVND